MSTITDDEDGTLKYKGKNAVVDASNAMVGKF